MTAKDRHNELTGCSDATDLYTTTYVRIVHGRHSGEVGYIYDDNNAEYRTRLYSVCMCAAGVDDFFMAYEMVPWKPNKGDRVIEVGVNNDYGTVLSSANGTSIIQWDAFSEPQEWRDDEINFAVTTERQQ